MNKTDVQDFLKRNGDAEEQAITLTLNEWAAVGVLVHLALQAGCPSEYTKSAYEKILAASKDHIAAISMQEWPDEVG